MRVSAQTKIIDRYATLDGLLVQVAIPKRYAPQIEDFLQRHVNNVGTIDITLENHRKPRSQNANGYLWVLCSKIGDAVGADKETVYKELVRRRGVFDYLLVKEHAGDRFIENWQAKGIGWFVEEIPYTKQKGIRQFMAYYGSSCYNTEQMAKIIDEAVDEAKALGIETMTPNELRELKSKWAKDTSS